MASGIPREKVPDPLKSPKVSEVSESLRAESQNYSPSFSARIEGQDPEGQDLTLEMWIRAGGVPEHAGPHYLISLPEGWSIQHLSGWDHWMFTSDTLTTHFSPGEEVTVSFTNWIGNLSPTDFVQAWAWGP